MQIVGKIRLALTPLVNHYWNVTLVTGHCGKGVRMHYFRP